MRTTLLTLTSGFGQTLFSLHLSWFALLIRLLAILVFWQPDNLFSPVILGVMLTLKNF